MNIRKLISGVLALVMVVCLVPGCTRVKDLVSSVTGPSAREVHEKAYAMTDQAIEAIKKKDAAQLEKEFCENTRDASAISKLMDSIEGDFVSLDQNIHYNLIEHVRFLYDEYAIVRSRTEDYTTTAGGYDICVVAVAYSKYDEKDVGVQAVSVMKDGDIIAQAGKILEKYDETKLPDKLKKPDMNQFDSSQPKREFVENLLYYIDHQDKDGFVSMFQPQKQAEAEITFDELIARLGKIKSYSYIDAPGGGSSWNKDHWEKMDADTAVYDILNSEGERFEISMHAVFVDTKAKNNEGIESFSLYKLEDQLGFAFEHIRIWEIAIE